MDTGTGNTFNSTNNLDPGSAAYGTSIDRANYWDRKSGPGPQVMAASTLTGDNVVTLTGGAKLGDIKEIMLDVPSGRIAYAVLSVGGFLGIGEKLIAIPWSALQLDTGTHSFKLNATKQQIEAAEGFDKDRWPSMADERWATSVHNFYGAPYYWR